MHTSLTQCNYIFSSCDKGYFGDFCVPAEVLPCELLDTFNNASSVDTTLWLDTHGAEVSRRCGVLVAKTALVFFKVGVHCILCVCVYVFCSLVSLYSNEQQKPGNTSGW